MVEDRDAVRDVIAREVHNGEAEGNPRSVEFQPPETVRTATRYVCGTYSVLAGCVSLRLLMV